MSVVRVGGRFFGLAVGLVSVLALASAGVVGAGDEERIDCGGRSVEVNGTGRRVTLTGRCPSVEVNGTNHVVRVEGLGDADVSGVNNRLEWEYSLSSGRPDIDISGLGNKAVQVPRRTSARPKPKTEAPRSEPEATADDSTDRNVKIGPIAVPLPDKVVTEEGQELTWDKTGPRRRVELPGGISIPLPDKVVTEEGQELTFDGEKKGAEGTRRNGSSGRRELPPVDSADRGPRGAGLETPPGLTPWEPVRCNQFTKIVIEKKFIETSGNAVVAEQYCQVVIRDSHIVAGGYGVEAIQYANVTLENTVIEGAKGAVNIKQFAQVAAAGTTLRGGIRGGGTFKDNGANVLDTPR